MKKSYIIQIKFALIVFHFTSFLIAVCALHNFAYARAGVYDFGGGLHYFAGKAEKSLAPSSATMVRLGGSTGEGVLRWVTQMSVESGSGQQDFSDAGATTNLTYTLMGGEFGFGFGMYPLGDDSKLAVQPFLSATGNTHLASISFDKDATVSAQFPKSDATMMFGYALAIGADFSLDKSWGLKIQVERALISGTFAASAFELSGERVLVGIFVR